MTWDNWINEKAGEAEQREAQAAAILEKKCHRLFCSEPATTSVVLVSRQREQRFSLCLAHFTEVQNVVWGVRTQKSVSLQQMRNSLGDAAE